MRADTGVFRPVLLDARHGDIATVNMRQRTNELIERTQASMHTRDGLVTTARACRRIGVSSDGCLTLWAALDLRCIVG
jgi:hypothetical protein